MFSEKKSQQQQNTNKTSSTTLGLFPFTVGLRFPWALLGSIAAERSTGATSWAFIGVLGGAFRRQQRATMAVELPAGLDLFDKQNFDLQKFQVDFD